MNEHVDPSISEQSKKVESVEYVGPIGPLPGEIAIMDAVNAGWASHSHLSDLARRGVLTRRRASRYNSFLKIEDLKKVFGENPPGVKRRKRQFQKKYVAPLNITKEERRIIFGAIDSHYFDELRGYADGWSDEKVASYLKVPVGWVRSVREENFGPEKGNELELATKELKSYISLGDEILGRMRTFWIEKDQIIKKIIETQDQLVAESRKVHAAMEISRSKICGLTQKK
jgi:hypothetical protein